MGRHFGGLCPNSAPFPCLDGCNTSYQLYAHLRPSRTLTPSRTLILTLTLILPLPLTQTLTQALTQTQTLTLTLTLTLTRCAHLRPSQLRPGYFKLNRHLIAAPHRFGQFGALPPPCLANPNPYTNPNTIPHPNLNPNLIRRAARRRAR